MRGDMQVNGSKRGVLIDHSADRLIGQSLTGLICKKMIAVLNLRIKIRSVFF